MDLPVRRHQRPPNHAALCWRRAEEPATKCFWSADPTGVGPGKNCRTGEGYIDYGRKAGGRWMASARRTMRIDGTFGKGKQHPEIIFSLGIFFFLIYDCIMKRFHPTFASKNGPISPRKCFICLTLRLHLNSLFRITQFHVQLTRMNEKIMGHRSENAKMDLLFICC